MLTSQRVGRDTESDGGFSMIELLVVIIIIGILAAIAIPVFLKQRQKGYDAAVKSDLVNAANAEESYVVDFSSYTDSVPSLKSTENLKFSAAADYSGSSPTLSIVSNSVVGYCITATSASGNVFFYDSGAGGVQPLKPSYVCSVAGVG